MKKFTPRWHEHGDNESDYKSAEDVDQFSRGLAAATRALMLLPEGLIDEISDELNVAAAAPRGGAQVKRTAGTLAVRLAKRSRRTGEI